MAHTHRGTGRSMKAQAAAQKTAILPPPSVETATVWHDSSQPTFADNRPESIAQRKLADAMDNHPFVVAQRQRLNGIFGGISDGNFGGTAQFKSNSTGL